MRAQEQSIFDLVLNVTTALGSIAAIIISILAIYYATQDNRKQIISSKIEEAYEILLFLKYNYYVLRFLYIQLEDSRATNYTLEQRQKFHSEYLDNLKIVSTKLTVDDLFQKTSRLTVLANSYLETKLKIDVLALNDLFVTLISISLRQQIMFKDMFYKEGFPEDEIMNDYIEKLEEEFVRKINLGKNHIGRKKINEYRDNEFKKKLNLK